MRSEYLGGRVVLYGGDSRDVLRGLADASISSIVCDPPYALVSIGKRFGKDGSAPARVPEGGSGAYARASSGFMGKDWDTGETAFAVEFWQQCLRVLKPGGHVVAFAGTRTYHRLACAIEDAGFEIRDQLAWVYGSGFPKSHDVAKGIAKRRVEDIEPIRRVCRFLRTAMDLARVKSSDLTSHFGHCHARLIDHWAARDTDSQPALPTAEQWRTLCAVLDLQTAADFAFFDAEVARLNDRKGMRGAAWSEADIVGMVECASPGFGEHRFSGDRTLRALEDAAAPWSGWGTALKPAWEPIVLARKPLAGTVAETVLAHGTGALNIDGCRVGDELRHNPSAARNEIYGLLEGAEKQDRQVLGRWPANIVHDDSDEVVAAFPEAPGQQRPVTGAERAKRTVNAYGDFGSTRHGAEPRMDTGSAARFFYSAKADKNDRIGSKHPTVKPVDLMQWLCRLVTPPGGTVLDPFAGSGSTGEAAWREGFNAILIEREEEYQADIAERLRLADQGPVARKARAVKQVATAGPLFGDNDNAPPEARGGRSTDTSPIRTNDWPDRSQALRTQNAA